MAAIPSKAARPYSKNPLIGIMAVPSRVSVSRFPGFRLIHFVEWEIKNR
jgi:hypothetical protein